MPQPASRDGGIDGSSIATLFHFPVVPAPIIPGPSHDVTYADVHLECGVAEPNSEADHPRNSTCCTAKTFHWL